MGGQFHDILPGTATPKSFEFAWNDDVIALNNLPECLQRCFDSVIDARHQHERKRDRRYNPLNIQREDIVEATVTLTQPGRAESCARQRTRRQGSARADI